MKPTRKGTRKMGHEMLENVLRDVAKSHCRKPPTATERMRAALSLFETTTTDDALELLQETLRGVAEDIGDHTPPTARERISAALSLDLFGDTTNSVQVGQIRKFINNGFAV